MTTITFQKPIILDKYDFDSVEDFLMNLYHFNNKDVDLDFYELDEKDISEHTKKLITISMKKDLSLFSSISSK